MRDRSDSRSDTPRAGHPAAGRDPATKAGKKRPANAAPRRKTAAGRDPATGTKPGESVNAMGRDPATKTKKG